MKTKYRYWNPGPKNMVDVIFIHFMHSEVTFLNGLFYQTLPLREEYLMQSTGLFDKNGTEIFEGDIIKMRFPRDKRFIGRFKVIKDTISPKIVIIDESLTTEKFDIYNYKSDYYEVIGNVFEGERENEK